MILVVGGTGELGRRIVARLAAQGRPVRCLVRPGSDVDRVQGRGVEVVTGDLTDAAGLPGACAGVDTVVHSATAIGRVLAGTRRPGVRDVDEQGALALVAAARAAGVGRFVYVSYAGVEAGLGFPVERAKVAVEAAVRQADWRGVVVRPDAFQEVHLAPLGRFDVRTGRVAVFGRGDQPHRWVATDDVAALVAALATEEDPPALVTVGGPEALTRNEAVALAERLTGRRFRVQRLPRGAVRVGMRVLAPLQPAVASLFGLGLVQDTVPVDWDDGPLRDRGIVPRSATDWITAATEPG